MDTAIKNLNKALAEHKRFLISKEDVWANGKTMMSSASRDIFDHFYLAIHTTFRRQFSEIDINLVARKILGVRAWEFNHLKVITAHAEDKLEMPTLSAYSGQMEFDWDLFDNNDFQNDEFDPKIYLSFDDFFENANHGYIKSSEGKVICKRMWDCFIQDISLENIKISLTSEINLARAWLDIESQILKKYLKENPDQSWFKFLDDHLDMALSDQKL